MKEKVSIIVPIYNERNNLEPFVASLTRTLESSGENYEVEFVDDGSTDGSGAYLETFPAKDPHLNGFGCGNDHSDLFRVARQNALYCPANPGLRIRNDIEVLISFRLYSKMRIYSCFLSNFHFDLMHS
jgi:glycosyltransferase involved in cell wall biosynthesis